MSNTRLRRRDAAWNPPARGGDVTALFALFAAVPMLLPLVARFESVLFALPLVANSLAAVRCAGVAPTRRFPFAWRIIAAAAALAAAASALAAIAAIDPGIAKPAFYVGAGASALLLAGVVVLAARTLARATLALIADALLLDAVVVALGVWFVVLPGLERHDVVLTLVFGVDLAALALASVGTLAAPGRERRRVGWCIVATTVAACVGDGFAALSSQDLSPAVTSICWMAAGIGLVMSARIVVRDDEPAVDGTRWLRARTLLPLAAVLSFPAIALGLALEGRLDVGAATFFSIFFVATIAIAFGRQAYLLVDNHRAMLRERRLSAEVVRRNRDLEALTTLAATMTESLEEEPVLERGLAALRYAARATSMALHTRDGGELTLRASAGEWGSEGPWATRLARSDWQPGVELRGERQIVRLAVAARDHDIGLLTFLRTADDPVGDEELKLLRLLVDQVAIAIQNARDYRDRLEQAIRDPLTGIYNRRFFYEAFEKELARSERYGSSASLVLVDVDNFKQVNDSCGHAAGDTVLCEIARVAGNVIRPTDSFARVGGEEFALLLPQSSQLEALLVAERLRRAVAETPIIEGRRVTISAGVCSCPDDGSRVEDLEQRADAALYWAKRNGKNLCAVASEVVVNDGRHADEGMLPHLHALVAAIDAEHLKTRDHSQNVAAYAAAIGQRLALTGQLASLRRAALFHDIGKIAVRASVLNKPAALNSAEYAEMQMHSVVGAEMLRHSGFPLEAEWVRAHHERIGGGGYPDGLQGTEIPFEARIIFVADSFEAMTSDRPYRRGMAVSDAVAELRRCAGSQFDERVVEVLCELLENDELDVLALRTTA